MQTELLESLHRLEADFAVQEKNSKIRAELQNYFDTLHEAEQDAHAPQLLAARVGGLRLLRALQNRTPPQATAPRFAVPISALCESAAFCADLLCGEVQKRVFFTGEADVFAACRPQATLWTVLNLLSNALRYSTGRYVFVDTVRVGARAVLTVASEGDFPVSAFYAAQTRKGSGLWFSAQTARLHGGTVYLIQSNGFASVRLAFPVAEPSLPQWVIPDFTDWLADGLSPIYTALCDSIFPNSAR
ncbi:MAG: hypothetical protein ACI4LB_04610 [Candidatus Fimenecus sp.]